MNVFISNLRSYSFSWPCYRISDLSDYGVEPTISENTFYIAYRSIDNIRQNFDNLPTLSEFITQNNLNNSQWVSDTQDPNLLNIVIYSYLEFDDAEFNDERNKFCVALPSFNAMLPVIEQLGRQIVSNVSLFKWLYIHPPVTDPNWNSLHLRNVLTMDFALRWKKTIKAESIILRECPGYELLSHGHQIRRVEDKTPVLKIITYLTEAFDSHSVTAGLFCLLFPLMFISILKSYSLRLRGHRIGKLIELFVSKLCDLVAFTVGDCEAHWSHFFAPLIRKSRARFTRYSVCYLALGSLFLGKLYTSFFSTDLLADLMNQQYKYIDTLSDFFAHRQQMGLTFISVASRFWDRMQVWGLPYNDNLTEDEIEELQNMDYMDRAMPYYLKIRQDGVISYTGYLGCAFVKMTDPQWHVKNYHCYTGYAVKRYNLVSLNPNTLSRVQFIFLRRLIRATIEGHLSRRITQEVSHFYHLSSMKAHLYEPHENELRQLDYSTMREILIGTVTLQVIIIASYFLCSLLTFIKVRYY